MMPSLRPETGDAPAESPPATRADHGHAIATLVVCAAAACVSVFACSSPDEGGSSSFGGRPPSRPPITDPDDETTSSSGSPLPPASEGGTLQLVQIVAGTHHTCVRWSDGVVKCWGANEFGQLGLGDIENRGDEPDEMGRALPMANMGTGARAQIIGAGGRQTCAVLADGAVKCWGANFFGGLGQPDEQPRGDAPETTGDNLLPVDLGTGKTARDVGVGDFSVCALLNDGTVKCWGSNFGGELGYGDEKQRGGIEDEPTAGAMGDALPPVDVGLSGIERVTMTSATAYQSGCALTGDGKMKCWGGNNYGQLGIGDRSNRGDDPAEMGGQLPLTALGENAVLSVPGYDAMCAVLQNGYLRCWGNNEFGQLGYGDTELRGHDGQNVPLLNLGQSSKVVHASMYEHTCAVFEDRTLKCWGNNQYGQLGYGDALPRGATPSDMGTNLPTVDLGNDTPLEVAAGEQHTCVRFASNKVKCWGSNEYGQLGYGDRTPRGASPGTMGAALPYVDLGR